MTGAITNFWRHSGAFAVFRASGRRVDRQGFRRFPAPTRSLCGVMGDDPEAGNDGSVP